LTYFFIPKLKMAVDLDKEQIANFSAWIAY
jgi:hypothetical protein